jgi:hypothetical protein
MALEQATVRKLYRKLLTLYPRAFREQLGESMDQTFNDLCNERMQRAGAGWFRFVLWVFVETAAGIVKERIHLVVQGGPMKAVSASLGTSVIIGLLLVVPYMILELVNRRAYNNGFPIVLFGLLWLLQFAFVAILKPILRDVRRRDGIVASPVSLVLQVVFLVFIACLWGVIIEDQWPCFMGVENCD